MQETWVPFLGQEDPLEKGMATYSSILACKIPWTEESGGLQSMQSQRVRHDWAVSPQCLVWHCLVGNDFWVSLVAQTVKNLPAVQETWVRSLGWEDPLEKGTAPHSSISGLENSMDRGTWQATVHGIAKSHTLLSNFHAQSFWKCWWEERWLIFRVSLVGAEEGSSMWLEPQVQSREAGFGWRSCQVMGWLACNRLRLGERLEWRGGWAQGSHALKWHPYSLKFRLPPLHPAHPASQRVKC